MDIGGDRDIAHVCAYALLERAQSVDCSDEIDALVALARHHGWHDVECVAHYARLALTAFSAADVEEQLAAMETSARRADDPSLAALAMAARATHALAGGGATGSTDEQTEAGLALAVATLDEGMGSPVDRPTAYVECSLAYTQRGLWELAAEMTDRAGQALQVPLSSELVETAVHTRRAVVVNRTETLAIQACGLIEVGQRETARRLARMRTRPTAQQVADLPAEWAVNLRAVEHLLEAIAGEPPTTPGDRLVAELEQSLWSGYSACVLMAAAIRAFDAHDLATAAEECERALALLDGYDLLPTVRTLALNGAALADPAPAALRYARELALLRWEARLHVLGSARARLEAARVIRDGARLAEHAYVDELTGLANRHAYARHRRRLEGHPGQLAALLVDVDHFKAVNDTFGHIVGDEVLRRIGAILIDSTRAVDLAVRLGGDEFLVLIDSPGAREVARRGHALVEAVARASWSDLAPGLRVTVSIGVAVGTAADVDALVRAADHNLYSAKAAGRGRTAHA